MLSGPAILKGRVATSQMDMYEARRKELGFFKGNPAYADLKNVGTGFLSSKLSTQLIGAIRRQLPNIQNAINGNIIALEKEIESLGGPGAYSRGAMVHLVLTVSISAPVLFHSAACSWP